MTLLSKLTSFPIILWACWRTCSNWISGRRRGYKGNPESHTKKKKMTNVTLEIFSLPGRESAWDWRDREKIEIQSLISMSSGTERDSKEKPREISKVSHHGTRSP